MSEIKEPKVLVAGDFFLDHYYYGETTRISPEAPVPVLRITGEKDVPGGAANVVNNLCELGCMIAVVGQIGADWIGNTLIKHLQNRGADTVYLRQSPGRKTILKGRVVAGANHQIVRLDFNENDPPLETPDTPDMIAAISNCDVAVLSDYGKGFCSENTTRAFIDICKQNEVPIIVDPKGTAWEKYRGVDFITPNLSEFAAVLGKKLLNTDEDVVTNIGVIAERYNIANVLVTRSDQGMTLLHGGEIYHFRAKAREVFDVSGAGDTVVAILAAMLASGTEVLDAVEAANLAAGVVVGKAGTATITRAELEREKRFDHSDFISAKIMDWSTLFSTVAKWKKQRQTIAVANGCFDIFHKGHASLIGAASRCADRLIMAINSDKAVRKLKGDGRPVNSELDRAYVLAAMECVDAVVVFPQDTPKELLSQIRPNVLVKSAEYTIDQVAGREYAARVELVNYINGYSTTSIVRKVLKGE